MDRSASFSTLGSSGDARHALAKTDIIKPAQTVATAEKQMISSHDEDKESSICQTPQVKADW
ncbi:hypothetical protein EYF80_067878 [Liparis tanakae]|uniref:Uncharacterized protein n=1 Tax=Liparis tanakae TaxID=230148 RepID=A0A4Z2E0J6_9TELE|nr:hypothetical protein EYF80_067878 [Liparis tanakae]